MAQMLKELMSVKGLMLLIVLVALVLSIIAVVRGCPDKFGDTCQGEGCKSIGINQPCQNTSDCNVYDMGIPGYDCQCRDSGGQPPSGPPCKLLFNDKCTPNSQKKDKCCMDGVCRTVKGKTYSTCQSCLTKGQECERKEECCKNHVCKKNSPSDVIGTCQLRDSSTDDGPDSTWKAAENVAWNANVVATMDGEGGEGEGGGDGSYGGGYGGGYGGYGGGYDGGEYEGGSNWARYPYAE